MTLSGLGSTGFCLLGPLVDDDFLTFGDDETFGDVDGSLNLMRRVCSASDTSRFASGFGQELIEWSAEPHAKQMLSSAAVLLMERIMLAIFLLLASGRFSSPIKTKFCIQRLYLRSHY